MESADAAYGNIMADAQNGPGTAAQEKRRPPMLKWIVLVIIPLLGLAITAVCIRSDWKKKHPALCETCKKLEQKSGGRYRCSRFCCSFGKPPEICSYYEKNDYNDVAPMMHEKVVRCKECKYWSYAQSINRHECNIFNGAYECVGYPTKADDFCSYGERKEGAYHG